MTEIGYRFQPQKWDGGVTLHNTHAPNLIALLAERLLSHFALVAAVDDGETSDGRQKFRAMTIDDAVQRSCDMAAAMVAEYEKRGWIVEIPYPPDESEETKDAA